ncbi:hypothetical protein SY88_11580 [Clostridiales bacterium PH28_bin88]|nr:hypothetical protein SY88_11580 [Clostridiales bacterium PH28_bin88]
MDNYATETDLEKIISRYVELLLDDVLITEIILFGSYAKGRADKDSDIDLAVISPDFGENVLRDLQLLSRKKIKVDPRIEAIAYHPNAIHKAEAGTFISEIIRTGKKVYPKKH